MGHSDLIGSVEARAQLKMARTTFYRAVQDGRIPYVHQLPGVRGAYLFDAEKIARLAESNNRRGELNTREGVS